MSVVRIWCLLCASCLLAAYACTFHVAQGIADEGTGSSLPPAADQKVSFAEHVAPVFRAKCYSCHGGEEEEGGLKLDVGQRALEGGDSGRAILPGKGAESPLLLRVAGESDDGPMPPEGEGTPLTDDEVALIRVWIDQGAEWPQGADAAAGTAGADHWVFQPIQKPAPPEVKNTARAKNGVDAFVLRKLEAEGVKPSPEADRATLIRRLFLDLIGLPPSPREWEQWMNDERADWYEQLVDRLLGSKHYGERWARHWLDLARYADSDGYEKDNARPHAWRWRDWVIGALNEDKAFDEFSIEQLAGDLFPNPALEQKVATGFHRNTLINREGGIDPEEDRVKRTVDRTNTLGTVWLGVTVECAQCHTHKFDPLTQKEYYELYAFFNTMVEPDIGAPLRDQMEAYLSEKSVFDQEHEKYLADIRQYELDSLPAALEKWEESSPETTPVWTILRPESVGSRKGASLEILDDGSVLASGKHAGRQEIYTVVANTDLTGITGFRIEAIADGRLPGGGPGRSALGNFHVTRFDVTAAAMDDSAEPVKVVLAKAQGSFSESGHGVERAVNSSPTNGWSIAPRAGENHVATFETKQPVGFQGGTKLSISIWQSSVLRHFHGLGRFRISVTTMETAEKQPLPLYGITDVIASTLSSPREERTAMMQQDLVDYFRMVDPELAKLRAAADEHSEKAPENPYLTTKAQVVAEMKEPRKTHFMVRGDFLQPDYEVQPDVPEVMPPLSPRGERPDRLDLARWMFDPAHPLTGRVVVNRIWSRYFGRGIVASVNDFGTQGERPSHPELLDWLATWFRANGWSFKKLHKLIVTSATYRQSSATRPELAERDPYNAWLSRQNRLRVEAETVRDLALSASGLIKHRIGGPSVRPPLPKGVAALGYAGSVKWQTSKGDDKYRRGLYTFFQRTVAYPMLMTFDMPESNLACTKRERSNTPLQALTLWNDPVFFECARALGKRIFEAAPDGGDAATTFDERIRLAFRLCLARDPSEEDLAVFRELRRTQREFAAANPQAVSDLTAADANTPADEAAELAVWILVGRTLMNLDEFITRS